MSGLPAQRRELNGGGWVELWENFVPDDERLMEQLLVELPLRQETLVIFGRAHLTPRLTSWHGDRGCSYRYSKTQFEPNPWTPGLKRLRDRLRDVVGYPFNSVLANYYRDGGDSMGEHADDEPELGPDADDVGIASVSLGAMRRFILRGRPDVTRGIVPSPAMEFLLGAGNLLVMGGQTQRHYRHRVPKTAKPVGPRMNLTFRVVRPRRLDFNGR